MPKMIEAIGWNYCLKIMRNAIL